MNLRRRICYLLARVRIHNPDCEDCADREMCGTELLKRLEELNWRTQPCSLKSDVPEVTRAQGDGEQKLSA